MRPQPWSFTKLDKFENCPKQFYETDVAKRWPVETTQDMLWGRSVHKTFENYLLYGTPLSADLQVHQEFLDRFKAQPGELAGEEKIALNLQLERCGYFDKDVWYRGQVDARKRHGVRAHILDHKTGKVKNDYTQLKSFALWEFLTQPQIEVVQAEYYWTQIRGTNGETYTRAQVPELLAFFAPKLHRYADAFLTNTWAPKQSGLCNGWCPVTTCEFWREKRKR